MSLFGKILFLLLCFIHLIILFAFVLPLMLVMALAMIPVFVMARAVLRENPNVSAMRGMSVLFVVMDLLLVWAGYATTRANAASAAQGGGLLGGWGEIMMAVAVVLGVLSAVCFFSLKRNPPTRE